MWMWQKCMNKESTDPRQNFCWEIYDCMARIIHSTFKFYCSATNSHELIPTWQWYDVWGSLSHHTCSLRWSLPPADGALKPHCPNHKPLPGSIVDAKQLMENMKHGGLAVCMTCLHVTENHTSKRTLRAVLLLAAMEPLWRHGAHTKLKGDILCSSVLRCVTSM